MDISANQARYIGFLLLAGMITGILSVAPDVDAQNYLTEAGAHPDRVMVGAMFQFMMGLIYLAVAVLFYPVVRQFGRGLALGFLAFRIMAATLVVVGTLLLVSLLGVSHGFIRHPSADPLLFRAIGDALKMSRDHLNHGFMILVLCAGNIMLYVLLLRSALIPRWLSVWGIGGTVLSATASVLVIFQWVEVITPEYLLLNVPTAILELILGLWLMVKGFAR